MCLGVCIHCEEKITVMEYEDIFELAKVAQGRILCMETDDMKAMPSVLATYDYLSVIGKRTTDIIKNRGS